MENKNQESAFTDAHNWVLNEEVITITPTGNTGTGAGSGAANSNAVHREACTQPEQQGNPALLPPTSQLNRQQSISQNSQPNFQQCREQLQQCRQRDRQQNGVYCIPVQQAPDIICHHAEGVDAPLCDNPEQDNNDNNGNNDRKLSSLVNCFYSTPRQRCALLSCFSILTIIIIILVICLSVAFRNAATNSSGKSVKPTPQELVITICDLHPCQHGGKCYHNPDDPEDYMCNCEGTGYKGPTCLELITRCDDNPCLHGGQCFVNPDDPNHVICDCDTTGFMGDRCETKMQSCDYEPCTNNGICTNDDSADIGYTCDCRNTDFKGVRCEVRMTACDYELCLHGGGCTDDPDDPYDPVHVMCDCEGTGYRGDRCQTKVMPCEYEPCMNNGVCTNYNFSREGYMCNCSHTDYKGRQCAVSKTACDYQPCLNGGECLDNFYSRTPNVGASSIQSGIERSSNRNSDQNLIQNRNVGARPNTQVAQLNPGSYTCLCNGTGYQGARCDVISASSKPSVFQDICDKVYFMIFAAVTVYHFSV